MLCDPKICTGCQACAQRCPKGSIMMVPDAEGFLAPKIDETRCTGCGLCEIVCPQMGFVPRTDEPIAVYAAKNKSVDIQMKSTSGGVFYALAESVIRAGGVVFGCVLDDTMYAKHAEADTMEKLLPLLGSKYVQSDIDGMFIQAKKRLDEGREVLFVGTSCQIAGLKLFLRRDYKNLCTLELICKGIPSPSLLKVYIQWREKQTGERITGIIFRTKEASRWGTDMTIRFDTKSGPHYCIANVDPFFNSFLKSYTLRNCCYSCQYNGKQRIGDLTVSDYWGLEYQHPEFMDGRGVSALMVYTSKGERLWEQTYEKFEWIESRFENVVTGNKVYVSSSRRPTERDIAYKDGFDPEMFTKNPAFQPTLVDRIFAMIPNPLKRLAKRVNRLRKGLHG